jgi:hypothetical protein
LKKTHYFSTHGCNRFVSCFTVGALDELAAAAACRALISKKLAIMLFEFLRVDDAVVVLKEDATRNSSFRSPIIFPIMD